MIQRERSGDVELVRLDRPPLNLLGGELVEAVRVAFEDIARDPPRVVVLHCWGAGADVRELVELDVFSARTFITALHRACASIRDLDAPVVAAVDGPCLGAHLEMAAVCDVRICSTGARFGMPEVKVGIPSVIDACWLAAICGVGTASRLVFTGEIVDAAEALRLGLVDRVAAALDQEATGWASEIASASATALAAQKRVVRDWTRGWYERSVAASVEHFANCYADPATLQALRAFLEKR